MKKFIGTLLLAASFSGLAGDKGNGGDPEYMYYEQFPNQELLSEAIDMAREKLLASNLPGTFVKMSVKEIETLSQDGKFLFQKEIIKEAKKGSKEERSGIKFISYAGYTEAVVGAPIFFSKRSLSYDLSSFTKLLLHETFHHTLWAGIFDEDSVIEDLAVSVMKGKVDERLQAAVKSGVYIRKGAFPTKQFILVQRTFLGGTVCDGERKWDSFLECFDKFMSAWNLPENAYNMPYSKLLYRMSSINPNWTAPFADRYDPRSYDQSFREWLESVGIKSRKFQSIYCKTRRFLPCSGSEQVLVKDVLGLE